MLTSKAFENSNLQKYKQIIVAVQAAISTGALKKGYKLPPGNTICEAHDFSRDTVLTAYAALKNKGVIVGVPGKGYYIKSVKTDYKQRVFLLFDELNAFKEVLYNSFLEALGEAAEVDIFVHHFNPVMYKKLIEESAGSYDAYAIMPANLPNALEPIKLLPAKQVYLLDQVRESGTDSYGAVYQHFSKDISKALYSGMDLLKKYERLVLVFDRRKEPLGMQEGFIRFCTMFSFSYEVTAEFQSNLLKPSSVYILPNDNDLVHLLKAAKTQKLIVGEDIGVISYNDTPLKEVVAEGITTISTDFKAMGSLLATMIKHKNSSQIANESSLIIRNSL